MQQYAAVITGLLLFLTYLHPLDAHGRLWDPPSRSSMWRRGFNTPVNYQDNELFCGGFQHQLSLGYKCGICGDAFDRERQNEVGGLYATGTISRTYNQGQTTVFQVQLTANHLGYFEFKLCPINDPSVEATQECLNRNPVSMADGSGYRYYPTPFVSATFNVSVILPPGLSCTHCVLQWRYHAGNNWGTEPNGTRCLGCGPQEEFYGCADITIEGGDQNTTPAETATTAGSHLTTIQSGGHTTGSDADGGSSGGTRTSNTQTTSPTSGNNEMMTNGISETTPQSTSATTTTIPTTTTRIDGDNMLCHAVEGVGASDNWCQLSCQRRFCPSTHCWCERSPFPHPVVRPSTCRGAGVYAYQDGYDLWCRVNCAAGNCPSTICTCSG